MLLWWILGCPTAVEPDDFCQEVGYAIAGRTQECTGQTKVAEARYTTFAEAYRCKDWDVADTAVVHAEDLYACPLAIRELPCELVSAYDDDLDAWLEASPMCALLVEAK